MGAPSRFGVLRSICIYVDRSRSRTLSECVDLSTTLSWQMKKTCQERMALELLLFDFRSTAFIYGQNIFNRELAEKAERKQWN